MIHKPNGGSLIKSKGQLLRDAEMKIGELEREKKWLTERLSYLVVAVNALGKHANLPPEEAKKVIDDFIAAEDLKIQEQMDVAKEKLKADIAAGKMPEFKLIDRTEK